MGDLSKHVSRHEVACKCGCGMASADIELVNVIEECVAYFEGIELRRLYVTFTSWNRCVEYNDTLPNASFTSRHPKGIAVDFTIGGIHDDDVADYLEEKYPNTYGIGRYVGRTHLDMRVIMARWDRR